jgi:hypothetical protein
MDEQKLISALKNNTLFDLLAGEDHTMKKDFLTSLVKEIIYASTSAVHKSLYPAMLDVFYENLLQIPYISEELFADVKNAFSEGISFDYFSQNGYQMDNHSLSIFARELDYAVYNALSSHIDGNPKAYSHYQTTLFSNLAQNLDVKADDHFLDQRVVAIDIAETLLNAHRESLGKILGIEQGEKDTCVICISTKIPDGIDTFDFSQFDFDLRLSVFVTGDPYMAVYEFDGQAYDVEFTAYPHEGNVAFSISIGWAHTLEEELENNEVELD